MYNFIQLEQMGLTMEQVEEYSEQKGYRCRDKEDYLANGRALKKELDAKKKQSKKQSK